MRKRLLLENTRQVCGRPEGPNTFVITTMVTSSRQGEMSTNETDQDTRLRLGAVTVLKLCDPIPPSDTFL